MTVIRPNCRARLTPADVHFVLNALGHDPLSNPQGCFDQFLDDQKVFSALLEKPECLSVSSNLYFYVLVRHVLLEAKIDDRMLSDYVAAVLSEFADIDRVRHPLPDKKPYDYMIDLLAALREADEQTQFTLRVHMGNLSLFLAGVFSKRIEHRARYKMAPDVEYFDQMGCMSYQVASDHPLAKRYDVAPVYQALSESFRPTREALNRMSERLVFLGD